MFGKHVSELNFSDIEYLIKERKEQEGHHLDYKKSIGNPDKAKNELAKDISSFANSSGGFLILGIDDNLEIVGLEREINKKSIDEWINQVVSSNIEPQVFYYDPKIIEIPSSEKVIVVIQVPESTRKPHIVSELFNYFVRINDSSKKANHSQIRDMFEFSRNRTDDFNAFLQKRNIQNEDDENFGVNRNSKTLYSEVPNHTGNEKPMVLFSLIPKYPNEEKLNIPFNEFQVWLEENSSGYEPYPSMPIYHASRYDNDLKLDGVVFKHSRYSEPSSYFEILNNGYVEAGFSRTLTSPFEGRDNKKIVAIFLTQIIGYEMLLLEWSKKFYDLGKYYDDVLFQLSFVNVLGLKLYGFNEKFGDMFRYEISDIANKHHNNFKLNAVFNPKTVSDSEILSIAKSHSQKICRAFGLDKDYCFVDDKISIGQMNNLYL